MISSMTLLDNSKGKNMKNWLKSAAGVMSLILLPIAILLLYLAWSDYAPVIPDKAEAINNILIGIGTNIIGIVITISFVQYFIDCHNITISKNKEKDNILKCNLILSVYINRYLQYFNCITKKIDSRTTDDLLLINMCFKFKNLSNIYNPTYIITDYYYKSGIEYFFLAEKLLREYILHEIEYIKFEYYPNIRTLLQQFIKVSLDLDCSDVIIENRKMKAREKKYDDWIVENISEYGDSFLHKFKEGDLHNHNNAMLPYIYLYFALKREISLLFGYCKELGKIDKNARKLIPYTFKCCNEC